MTNIFTRLKWLDFCWNKLQQLEDEKNYLKTLDVVGSK